MYVVFITLVLPILIIFSSGGKGGATTIDNNHQFSVAVTVMLKKNKKTC